MINVDRKPNKLQEDLADLCMKQSEIIKCLRKAIAEVLIGMDKLEQVMESSTLKTHTS